MDIVYKVNKTFAKVHTDPNPYIFVMGPVGSGKSSGCIWHCFMNACQQVPDGDGIRHSKYCVIRATYPALKSTTLKSWITWFKDKIKITYDTPIRAEIKYDLDDGTKINMEVLFIAVDNEQNVEKLRSLEVTGCWINEAKEIDESVFQMMKTRLRYPADKDGGPVRKFIILDYNAVSTDHWLYRFAEEFRPEGHSFYRQPAAVLLVDGKYVVNPEADNLKKFDPSGALDERGEPIVLIHGVTEDYYTTMCMGMDPDFIYVNVMNNYGEVRSGRPVYKDYDDILHCADRDLGPISGAQLVIGMDQGLTPSAIITQQTPDGAVLILDEITTEDCSLQEFCNDILWPLIRNKYKDFEKNFYVVCDPATVQRSMNDSKAGTDIIRESGLPYRTAKTNNFIMRKEAVTYFLRMSNKFRLSPACKKLRKGFISEYKYEEVRSAQHGDFKDKPAKNEFSHPHDALQYAMLEFYTLKEKKRVRVFRNKYKSGSEIGGY